jgi:hypothetical protein
LQADESAGGIVGHLHFNVTLIECVKCSHRGNFANFGQCLPIGEATWVDAPNRPQIGQHDFVVVADGLTVAGHVPSEEEGRVARAGPRLRVAADIVAATGEDQGCGR